jgi:hypothetical protein
VSSGAGAGGEESSADRVRRLRAEFLASQGKAPTL